MWGEVASIGTPGVAGQKCSGKMPFDYAQDKPC